VTRQPEDLTPGGRGRRPDLPRQDGAKLGVVRRLMFMLSGASPVLF